MVTIAIRARFEHDSTRFEESTKNERVHSFPFLVRCCSQSACRGHAVDNAFFVSYLRNYLMPTSDGRHSYHPTLMRCLCVSCALLMRRLCAYRIVLESSSNRNCNQRFKLNERTKSTEPATIPERTDTERPNPLPTHASLLLLTLIRTQSTI